MDQLPDESPRNRVMGFLRYYIKENGYPPSYREIAEETGLTSTSTVSRTLHQLQAEGSIDFKPGFPRTLRLLDSEQVSADDLEESVD